MITWLQDTFGKHNKTLFAILLGIIVLTFVLTIGPQSYFGSRQGRQETVKDFFGFNLASQEDLQALMTGARISAALHPRDTQLNRYQSDYMLVRGAGLGLANDFGIPNPTPEQFKQFLESRSAFFDDNGSFSTARMAEITAMFAASGITSEQISKTIVEDWRIDQVGKLVGGPGLILPFEARLRLIEELTRWKVVLFTSEYSAFQPEINPSEEELQAFYERNPANYEVPEKVRLKAVEFPRDNYLAEVKEPTESELENYFRENQRKFVKAPPPPKEGEEPTPPIVPQLADVRDEVLAALKNEQASRLAEIAADNFTVRLFRESIARASPTLTKMITEAQARTKDLEPFAREQIPWQLPYDRTQLQNSYQLNEVDYFSDVARDRQGNAVVLLFEEKIPSHIPPFSEVKEQVAAKYKQEERRKLFDAKGREIHQALQDGLASGKSPDDLASELNLASKVFPEFDGQNIPADLQNNPWQTRHTSQPSGPLVEQLKSLAQGQVSPMIFQANKGQFLYIEKKDQPEIAADDARIAAKLQELNSRLNLAGGWMSLQELASRRWQELDPPDNLLR